MPHLRRVAEAAIAAGALEPIVTDGEIHLHDGILWPFFVLRGRNRKVESLIGQDRDERGGDRPNPFLPYDPRMEVARLSPTHVCLLNKFPVIPNHLLIVTRAYERQDSVLRLEDFAAAAALIDEVGGLVFYNGGKAAGASQHHKHLQWLPLPLRADADWVPLAPRMALTGKCFEVYCSADLPFAHALVRLPEQGHSEPLRLLAHYRAMLRLLALGGGCGDPGPYNLLLTRSFMLVVPRAKEFHQGISINSMGYAGSMFVRDREQLARILAKGPLNFLKAVGFSR